jgi:HSP20 family protein
MTRLAFQPIPFEGLLNDIWNAAFNELPATATVRPAVNVAQTDTGFRIEVAAPGLGKEDFNVKVEGRLLSISAEKTATESSEAKVLRREFAYHKFERSFTLPDSIDADNIKAAYQNGVLTLELSRKPELSPIAKTIEIG